MAQSGRTSLPELHQMQGAAAREEEHVVYKYRGLRDALTLHPENHMGVTAHLRVHGSSAPREQGHGHTAGHLRLRDGVTRLSQHFPHSVPTRLSSSSATLQPFPGHVLALQRAGADCNPPPVVFLGAPHPEAQVLQAWWGQRMYITCYSWLRRVAGGTPEAVLPPPYTVVPTLTREGRHVDMGKHSTQSPASVPQDRIGPWTRCPLGSEEAKDRAHHRVHSGGRHFRAVGGRIQAGGLAPLGVAFIPDPCAFSYADFVTGFLLPNLPCVFSSAFTASWGSRRRWVTPEGKPDFKYLLSKYGDVVVPVANCGVQEYNSNPKELMPLRDYIAYWQEYIQCGDSSPRGCLYLKDWHLCRDSPAEDLEDVFTLPAYFSSDWLNEFWDALGVDDYRFVYAGPRGTCWSVNICGRKKWLLFPPGQEEALRDSHGTLPYDVTSPALTDTRLHPAHLHSSPPLEVMQEAGEMLFVPSGWHHQVHNLDDTISINHNWVNGCNLANMWHFLQQELQAVQREVGQWKDSMPDWHHHCQVIMRSCSGINFEEFYHFLKVIAERRLLVLRQGEQGEVGPNTGLGLGLQQAAFDIGRLAEVLASMVTDPDFQRVDTSSFSPQPWELLRQLEDALVAIKAL
ncbi:2-oxoglutarate and iron-dependent oxygenase JMJD4 [Fukomys damarensis]|uniref:2-oxoglutarate and iron-dependent oxygenase JMJD4 n=1 Tax=Fukomys damarensis TaxID=885580 RepID=UPI001455A9A7|nr:2-oxoglutarate and iron-dependent oxygenase JMJD4 [Fukomys damarensis]